MNWRYLCRAADLQPPCRGRETGVGGGVERALPCLLLQPVKTNCSHVSITHFPFLLIRSGPRVRLLCYFYFNYSWINTFPWRGNLPPRESPPHAGQISTLPTIPWAGFSRSVPSQFRCSQAVEMKAVLRNCQHFWLCCHQRATFLSLKVMLARCLLEKMRVIGERVAITF